MDNEILVSIRCIAYNHEPYIRQCLEGFVMQRTNFHFEAIVHDDASTDGTTEIIREYARKYPEIIRPIFEIENQYSKHDGSIRRILGAEMRGKYIASCEGDDYWTDPLKLQKQVDYMEAHPECGMCYTDYSKCDANGEITVSSVFQSGVDVNPKDFCEHLFHKGYIAPMTWMYRSEYLSLLNEITAKRDGSFAFALEMFRGSNIGYLPDMTAVYRIHDGSASHPRLSKDIFLYKKDVFDTQRYYGSFLASEKLRDKLVSQGFLEILPLAFEINETDFIEDARCFFDDKNIDFSSLTVLCETLNQCSRDCESYKSRINRIELSRPYKLGRAILKPIKFLLKYISI